MQLGIWTPVMNTGIWRNVHAVEVGSPYCSWEGQHPDLFLPLFQLHIGKCSCSLNCISMRTFRLLVSSHKGKTHTLKISLSSGNLLMCIINLMITCQFRGKKKHNKNNKLLYARRNKRWVYHIFKTRMNHLWKAFALWDESVCVFKEGINLASYTFACFLAPKPDLWTASEEPPGTMSSLRNIWLVFQWSKPTRHYESNADENMFSTVNQQAFGGEEGLLVGEEGTGGCKEWHKEYDSLMSRYKIKAAISFQVVLSVLNRFTPYYL